MEPNIILEEDEFLVLDKPAGWITNDADTTGPHPVVQSYLKKYFDYEISQSRELRSGIVHRLDKETSGILLVAKSERVFYELQRQFKERIVKKTYSALVHGRVGSKEGEIKTTVGRLPWRRDRFGIIPGGRDSVTKYKVVSNYLLSSTRLIHLRDYSLLEFYPQTGRTHQIRIHAKYIGHPIVSDDFYAGRKTARADRKWCPRLFLHAGEITFLHPTLGKMINFKSPLPDELISGLQQLSKV